MSIVSRFLQQVFNGVTGNTSSYYTDVARRIEKRDQAARVAVTVLTRTAERVFLPVR
jgi:hypothetical protein